MLIEIYSDILNKEKYKDGPKPISNPTKSNLMSELNTLKGIKY